LLNSTAIRLPWAQDRIEIRLSGAAAKSRQSPDLKSIFLPEGGFLRGLKKFTAAVSERQSPIGPACPA
jgi:hypothetical protein